MKQTFKKQNDKDFFSAFVAANDDAKLSLVVAHVLNFERNAQIIFLSCE